MQNRRKGFTIMEMLIVVAIIAVLVTIAIPVFNGVLEKSREAADLANVRAAYAEVMTSVTLEDAAEMKVVSLKQKQNGWQSIDPVTIGGITHSNADEDTPNWKGNPSADGTCEISYNSETGILFDWKGGAGGDYEKKYFFNYNDNPHSVLNDSGILENLIKQYNSYFEIDSRCPNSDMVPIVTSRLPDDSLLKHGTWAYIGKASVASDRYLLWTSVNTDTIGKNQKIPIIISTADGKYYVSESTTAERKKNSQKYIAVAPNLNTVEQRKEFISKGTEYNSLKEAYDAYEKQLTEGSYQKYRDTLPQE